MENKPRAHSTIDNQNEVWMDMKGAWLTYGLSVTFLHLLILSIPIFATATAWTLTNVIHDVVRLYASWKIVFENFVLIRLYIFKELIQHDYTIRYGFSMSIISLSLAKAFPVQNFD